jgi:hypothetical protein
MRRVVHGSIAGRRWAPPIRQSPGARAASSGAPGEAPTMTAEIL